MGRCFSSMGGMPSSSFALGAGPAAKAAAAAAVRAGVLTETVARAAASGRCVWGASAVGWPLRGCVPTCATSCNMAAAH